MTALRFALAALTGAYALVGFVVAGFAVAFKLRRFSPPVDAPPGTLDFMAQISWPHLALWLLALALYLVVAIKLARRAKTFVFWAVAFVLDAINLMWTRTMDAYQTVAPPMELQAFYAFIAVNLLVGLLISWMGRTYLD